MEPKQIALIVAKVIIYGMLVCIAVLGVIDRWSDPSTVDQEISK